MDLSLPQTVQEVGVTPNNLGVPDLNGAAPTMGCLALVRPVNSLEGQVNGVSNEVPTYKIGLNWSPTDTDYFYAFYARRYKAGSLLAGCSTRNKLMIMSLVGKVPCLMAP